jgi:hypothetical protein
MSTNIKNAKMAESRTGQQSKRPENDGHVLGNLEPASRKWLALHGHISAGTRTRHDEVTLE